VAITAKLALEAAGTGGATGRSRRAVDGRVSRPRAPAIPDTSDESGACRCLRRCRVARAGRGMSAKTGCQLPGLSSGWSVFARA
jgi:hypothetical protein